MVFKVPESKASIGQNTYEFEIGGKVWTIKKFKFLSVGAAESMQATGSLTVMLNELDREAADELRKLNSEQFEALLNDWIEDSGIKPGE